MVVSRALCFLGHWYKMAPASDFWIISKSLAKKTSEMSENTIIFLQRSLNFFRRQLQNVEELLLDSGHENDRLRRESYNYYRATYQDLIDEYEDLKKEHEKLKKKIEDKNLTAELLEGLQELAIEE